MLKRVLVQFTKEEEVEYLSKYAKLLKTKYPELEIVGIYVKDLEKYDIPTTSLYGDFISIDSTDQWNKLENDRADKIGKYFIELIPKAEFYSKIGRASDVVLNELRLFDMLIISKNERLTHEIKDILRAHHKPILMVPKLNTYSFEKVLVADDQRLEVNKTFFSFMRMFEEIDKYNAITVNVDEDEIIDLNIYLKKIGKEIEYKFEKGHVEEIILDVSKEFDILLMGDLKYSFMIEKIVGKLGVKLLEDLEKPIFIA